MTRIALALGGGGAKGLAHIPMLEAFDELGLKPHRMAGTSFGAVIGASYASGISAAEIRAYVDGLIVARGDRLSDIFAKRELWRWLDLVDLHPGRSGLVSGEALRGLLGARVMAPDFDRLDIPLKVVAADYWSREEVVMEDGDLRSAVLASMAIPGLFAAAERDGRVLIDGGTVNPVPYDLWLDECDVTVAIDVAGSRSVGRSRIPGFFDAVFNSFQIMQRSILDEKLRRLPPDILVRPDIADVRVFEFFKAREVYAQAGAAKDELKRALERVLA